LESWIDEIVLDAIEMIPDGRGNPEIKEVNWGFKTREQLEDEEKKKSEARTEINT
jgi:hypothetical protein